MKNNRREFLKKTAVTGLGMTGALSYPGERYNRDPFPRTHRQQFNMSGYAAPKLDVVRTGIIGLGNRGSGTVKRLACIEGVEIRALCDLVPEKVNKAAASISPLGHRPDRYSGNEEEWKKICERKDIDLIAVVTPWEWHTPMCLYAMEHEKHAYTELPAAMSVEDCWKLVETSERTRRHCIQMSSSCHGYGGRDLHPVALNMVRQGFFGDIIHAEGAYIHQLLLGYLFTRHMYPGQWRLKENIGRHGNLYPQHGLVPAMQMMDINCGDKMDYLVSVSGIDFMMAETAEQFAAGDDYWKPFVGKDFRGNMNTTIIRTARGRTILVQHDVTSPRPNVRFNLVSGTRGVFQAPDKIATSHDGWLDEQEIRSLADQYMPEMVTRFNELRSNSREVSSSRGGYFRTTPLDWRLIDCLRNGLPLDMDVYEAAASSAVIPLSEWSVANHSEPVTIPDFTSGAWETNPRGMDLLLQRGGGTAVLR